MKPPVDSARLMPPPSLTRLRIADQEGRDKAEPLARRLEEAYRPIILRVVLRAAKNLKARRQVLAAGEAAWHLPDADELMNRLALERELAKAGKPIRLAILEAAMSGTLTEFALNLDLKNPLVAGVLEQMGKKITMISESLRADVMAQIADAWKRGLSIPDAAELITALASNFSTVRAAMIARTEMIGAVNGGSLAAAQMAGVAPYKQWLASMDSRVRPDHAEAHGQTVPIAEAFDVGGFPLAYPGDPMGPAEEVINCRCTLVYSDEASGDAQIAGGAMADESGTLDVVTLSTKGKDYQIPSGIVDDLPAALRELNEGITDAEVDELVAVIPNATFADLDGGSVEYQLRAAADTVEAVAEQPTGSAGAWTADPLIPYGVMTRDGRMIRAGGLAEQPTLPVPLMFMGEDVHGPSMVIPPSQLAGAITTVDDSDARLAVSGTLDDSDAGRASLAAITDGRMGISADLAVLEFEFVMSQEAVDEFNQMVEDEGAIDTEAETPSEDVEGGVVVEQGDITDMGVFVVTRYTLMGATIVPFAAFEESRIEVESLTADGALERIRVVMPVRRAPLSVTAPSEGTPLSPPSGGLSIDASGLPHPALGIAATLEALASGLRVQAGAELPGNGALDPATIRALAQLVAASQPDLSVLAATLTASAREPQPAPAPIIVNPPAIHYTAPEVRIDNHQPDVNVTGNQPRGMRIVRDKDGNVESYEPIEEAQ